MNCRLNESALPGAESRCDIYISDCLAIASLPKSPESIMPAFSHCHSEYEFIIPRTPIPFLLSESAVYFGDVGYVFPVQSNKVHGVKYSIKDVSHDDIIIDKSYFEDIMQAKGLPDVKFNIRFHESAELNMYISAFKKEYSKGSAGDDRKLSHLTALICCEIVDGEANSDYDERRVAGSYQQGVKNAAEFINRNFDKPLNLKDLAEMCALSPNYFSSCFKLMYGEPPFSYLTRLRVSTAKNMLSETNLSVSAIAEKCGFLHSCSFTAAFKSETGITPSQYRKK